MTGSLISCVDGGQVKSVEYSGRQQSSTSSAFPRTCPTPRYPGCHCYLSCIWSDDAAVMSPMDRIVMSQMGGIVDRFHCRFCCYCWQKNLKSNRHWINHSLSDKVAFRAVTGHLGWPTLLLEWEGMSWFCSCSWNKTLTVKSCIFTKFQFHITAWKSYIWGPCDRIVKGWLELNILALAVSV